MCDGLAFLRGAMPVGEFENGDGLHERVRLPFQALGRRGGFFHKRRVLLGVLIDLGDGLVHLLDAAALLLASSLSD